MKRLLAGCLSVMLLGGAVLLGNVARPRTADDAARAAALKLFRSLTAEQKQLAVKDFKDKDRHTEAFPPVQRPGVPFSKLTAEQKALVNDVLRAMTTEYGTQRCLAITRETPEPLRFLTFFGEPAADRPFAWRVAMHHLTLVYAEFGTDPANEFGPVLLGGNPAGTLWDGEEKIALDLYAALSPEEAKDLAARSKAASPGSGAPLGKAGVRVGDLGERARQLARALLQQRLEVLSADRRKVMEAIIQRDGGVDNLRLAVWGAITKSHRDGGTYHWRLGGDLVCCDWQTVGRNHIHMTLRGRARS
jgi:hypothetical protein